MKSLTAKELRQKLGFKPISSTQETENLNENLDSLSSREQIQMPQSDFEELCEKINFITGDQGRYKYPSVKEVVDYIQELINYADMDVDDRLAKERKSWHEDDGAVLWWKFPITEPPYAGTPLDDDFPDYVTHYTTIPLPISICSEPKDHLDKPSGAR